MNKLPDIDGKYLRELRKSKGERIWIAAKAAGITGKTLWSIERGHAPNIKYNTAKTLYNHYIALPDKQLKK